jgi:hypothetical protein
MFDDGGKGIKSLLESAGVISLMRQPELGHPVRR